MLKLGHPSSPALRHGSSWFFGLQTWTRITQGFLMALVVKNPPANEGDIRDVGLIPGSGRSLEEGTAIRSSILAWRSPRTE